MGSTPGGRFRSHAHDSVGSALQPAECQINLSVDTSPPKRSKPSSKAKMLQQLENMNVLGHLIGSDEEF